MDGVRALRALGPIDFRSIARDSMLRWMLIVPLLIAALMRWGLPALNDYLLREYQFDLSPYYVLILSCNLLMLPSIIGVVIGFLLLDQKDDNTLSALQVSPLSLNGYLAYRITMPMVLSILVTLLLFPAIDLINVRFTVLLASSLLAALFAPLYAVFLASFANNKVQGFALMKGAGVVIWPPVFAYFIDSNWQLLFAIVPTYWPLKFFWIAQNNEPGSWIYFVVGLLYQTGFLVLLLRRFNRVEHSA